MLNKIDKIKRVVSGLSVQISSGSKNVSTGSYIFSQFSLLTKKLMQKFVLNKSKRNFTATTGGYLRLHNGQNSAGCRLLLRTINVMHLAMPKLKIQLRPCATVKYFFEIDLKGFKFLEELSELSTIYGIIRV